MNKGEYIVIQTKKPMSVLMRNADNYICTKELDLPHQYYYDIENNWSYECVKEHTKWGEVEYLAMISKKDNFKFTIALKDNSCQMFYLQNN